MVMSGVFKKALCNGVYTATFKQNASLFERALLFREQ